MGSFRKIREDYRFSDKDATLVQSLYDIVAPRADELIQSLENRILEIGDPPIHDKVKTHPDLPRYHKQWLLHLFRGPYDNNYYKGLVKIGRIHAREGIDPHYVSASMNAMRVMLIGILSDEIEDRRTRTRMKEALNKLIDINLDVITSSYVEQEIEQYSVAYKLRSKIINFAEQFSGAMNMVLVFALILITLGVVGLFFYDLYTLMEGNISKGIITALGSLLILWVLIELMNTEISHLKGGKFNISVFIGVALVAFIRDLMIATLKHEQTKTSYYLIAAILVLGLVYWLVTRSESRKKE